MGFSPTPGSGSPLGAPVIPIPLPGQGGGGADPASIEGNIASIESWTQDALNWQLGALTSVLKSVLGELKSVFEAVWKWLQKLWASWLGNLIRSVWNKVKEIYEKVKTVVEEILCYLHAWEALQDYYWRKIFEPILQVLSSLRRVVLIFRVFHLKFASELDQWLAQREAALGKLFLGQRNEVNRVISWLNMIIDPLGLFNEGLYIQSALRSIGDLWNALHSVGSFDLGAKDVADQQMWVDRTNATQTHKDMVIVSASGILPADQALTDQFNEVYTSWGYQL